MKTRAAILSLLMLSCSLSAPLAHADSVRRVTRSGPEGGQMAGRHAIRSDGAGNGMVSNARVLRTPEGGVAGRAGITTRAADGSVNHRSAMGASGSKGSVYSAGSSSRDAEGNVSQNRNTVVNNASTGNSYQGSSSYNKDSGFSHSGTCYDAGGAVIACPGR